MTRLRIHVPKLGKIPKYQGYPGSIGLFLVDGIQMSQSAEWCEDPKAADVILYDFRHLDAGITPEDPDRSIIVDFSDHPYRLYHGGGCSLYFKRSMVRKPHGMPPVFADYPREVLPYPYAMKGTYLQASSEASGVERDIDVGCFFSPNSKEHFRSRVARAVLSLSPDYTSRSLPTTRSTSVSSGRMAGRAETTSRPTTGTPCGAAR